MEVVKRNRVTPFITKDGSEIREILAPRNSSIQNQSLAEASVASGQATEEHRHVRTEELYYVLRGSGRMWIEGDSTDVGPGDGIAILPGQRHRIENMGASELVFLCCCSPAYTHEDTELTGGPKTGG